MAPPELAPRRAAATAAVLLVLNFAATTNAHEHHMDNIEEGNGISDDPIVCQREDKQIPVGE